MADRSIVVRMRAEVSNLKSGMADARKSIEGVGAASQAVGKSQGAAAKAGVDWGAKAASAGKAVATAFTTATVATGAMAVSALKAGAAYNGMQQASRAALTTILGGAEAANAQMDKLDEFATKSPFSKAVFIKAQQQLLGFGLEAEKVIPSLNAIQDAVAAVGGSNTDIASITDSLAKMQGQGKLTGKTLNELGLYGINAAAIIGDSMGMTGEEIRDMASSPGGIPVDQIWDPLINGLQTRFDGAAANVKKTWAGATDRIKAAWRDIGSALAEPFVGKKGGGAAVQWANDVADVMRAAQKQIAPIADVLMPRLAGSFGKITPALQKAKKAIDGFDVKKLSGPLDQISKAAPGLAGAGAALFAIGGNSLGLSKLGMSLNPVAAGLTALVMTSPEARKAVFDLLDAVSPLIPIAGQLATVLAGVASEGIGALGGAVSAVVPLVSGLMTGVEALVTAFGWLPGPIQAATVGLVALNVALGSVKVQAAVSSMMGMVDTLRLVGMYAINAGGPIKGVKAALSGLGIGAGGADKAAGRLNKTLGGIGKAAMGIGLVGTAVAMLGNEMDRLNVGKLEVDLAKSSNAAKDLDDAINSLNREGFGQGATNVRSMGDALRFTFNPGFMDQAFHGIEGIFGIFGAEQTNDISVAAERIKEVDAALAGMIAAGNVDQAKALMASITAEAAAQGISVEELERKFPGFAAAMAKVGDEAKKAAGGTSAMKTQTERLEEAASDAQVALDDLKKAIMGLGSPVAEQRSATRAYKAAIDDMKKSIKDNGHTLNDNTAKGRANAEQLDKIRDSALAKVWADFQVIESTKGTQAATKAATETMRVARQDFIDSYTAARGGAKGAKEEAKKLADQLGLIPSEVPILVKEHGAEDAGRAIDKAAKDRHAKIIVREEIVRANVARNTELARYGQVAKADGGPVFGAGSATSDSIPAWLSNGEFVVRTAAAQAIGYDRLAHMNRTGSLPAFAQGGRVGFASGGVASLTTVDRAAIMALVTALSNPIRDLATATKALSSATAGLKAPQAALTAATSAKARADQSVATAQKRLAADKQATAAAKARQTAGLAEVTAAKKRLDSLKAVRTQQGLEKRELQARITSLTAAAKATKGVTKADRDLAAAKKQMERLNASILKQDRAIAAQNTKVKTAQDKTAKSQAANAKAVDKAKAKEATSSAALTKAKDAAKAATDRQKAAQDALKAAQDRAAEAARALAEQQKRVADEAERVSDQFRSQVDGPGRNIAAWIDRLKTGATDISKFAGQVEQLRNAGLDETLVQQIIGAGARGGSRVASGLLADKSAIKDLNKASDALQTAADKLGLLAATGIGRYAGGGAVGGRSGVDRNLALLTRGEHVLDTSDVRAMGGHANIYAFRAALHDPANLRSAPMVASSAGIDYDRLAAAIRRGGGGAAPTFIAQGLDADAAVQRAMRQWAHRAAVGV